LGIYKKKLKKTMSGQSTVRAVLKLLFCVTGIYGAYITQGFFQETLSTQRFGPQKARFPHLATMNAFQSWACFLWAFFLMQIQNFMHPPSEKEVHPPAHAYWRAGATNCIGPACGFQALYYISYPAQVLAKSSKMIPVMVLGTVLHGRRYPFIEYICCFMITAGVSIFAAMGPSKHAKTQLASPNPMLGYTLCLLNLGLDAYTNVAQDEINKKYKGGTAMHMMCWMNFWTGLFYIPLMFVFTSSGSEVVAFCLKHPDAGTQVLLFCLCGAVGQLFIFFTIKAFGSLINTLVTTTRKFFSILTSVVWNGNSLALEQWGAVVLVFTGLIMSSVTKHRKHRSSSIKAKTL
jgi:solute carrier family 35 (UDP-galactose transporter), member B1